MAKAKKLKKYRVLVTGTRVNTVTAYPEPVSGVVEVECVGRTAKDFVKQLAIENMRGQHPQWRRLTASKVEAV